MNPNSTDTARANLEHFRQLLFHMQMQCGSIHDLFRHFKEEENMQHFEALKSIDPSLMSQLLAREYVLEAQKSIDRMDARTHLSTALQLDPRCPEAFLELASISETPEAAMKWYDKCMSFIVNQLGSKKMDELMESFKANPWHQVELHCYMKAKVNLAEKLFREGYYEVANIHFRDMIEWDKNDEVCCRHFHAVSLLCENRLSETRSLLLKYPTDLSAQWYYIRAFLKFKQEGETRRSNRLLMRAFKRNLWAAIYVLGLQEMPMVEIKDKIPVCQMDGSEAFHPMLQLVMSDSFKEGGQSEGVDCVRCIAPIILEDEQLAAWLWEMLKGMV